jgi:hypothetical protein
MAKRLRDVWGLPESECSGVPDAASSSARQGRSRHSVRAALVNQNTSVDKSAKTGGRGLPQSKTLSRHPPHAGIFKV